MQKAIVMLAVVLFAGCGPLAKLPVPPIGQGNCPRLQAYIDNLNAQLTSDAGTGDSQTGNPSVMDATPVSETVAAPKSNNPTAVPTALPPAIGDPDFVKTDGSNLFVLKSDPNNAGRGRLSSFNIAGSGEIKEVNSVTLTGAPSEFLMSYGKILVVSHGLDSGSGRSGMFTHLVKIDSDKKLVLNKSLFIEQNQYVTSRLVGSGAYIVTQGTATLSSRREVTEEMFHPAVHVLLTEAEPQSKSQPRRIGSCETTLISDATLNISAPGVPNQLVWLPPPWASRNVISVISIPMDGDETNLNAASVITTYGTTPIVSVSADAVYIGEESASGSDIYKFSIDDQAEAAVFAAKGSVPGRLMSAYVAGGFNDQFSMDEYNGYLRVATTDGYLGGGGNSTAKSSLYVLQQEGHELKTVGKIEDLHHGEAIYAVRFVGDRGYVVTFKKIDPLFVIDLSHPKNPTVAGELEMPGFSTFIKPVGENILLALGKDADDQGTFAWYGGLKLSLFDVRDPARPRVIDSVVIGKRGTESEALRDYRALSYFEKRGLLALPVDLVTEVSASGNSSWRSVGMPDHSEEQIWQVDLAKGFTFVGAVQHDTTAGSDYWHHNQMRRAFDVSDRLVTLSDDGIATNDFSDLGKVLGTFGFEKAAAPAPIPFPECWSMCD